MIFWKIACLVLGRMKSPGLTVMLNMEVPLIVKPFVSLSNSLFLNALALQGILPTLIIVLVHFDLVTGGGRGGAANKPDQSIDFRTMSQIGDSVSSAVLSVGNTLGPNHTTSVISTLEEQGVEPHPELRKPTEVV
jgi:hypothetical protein